MNETDIAKLQARAEDLRTKMDAIKAAVPHGFGGPEHDFFFSLIDDLASRTIEAVEFLTTGSGEVDRLQARAEIVRTQMAVLKKVVSKAREDAKAGAFFNTIYELADDAIQALEFQADVRAEVDRATKGSDSDPAA